MGFSTDYSDVKTGSGGVLPEGEYEVIIKYAGEDTTRTGTVYINVTMVLRNDVEQAFKNNYIWHKLWQRKEPSPADLAMGGYSSKQINSLSQAAGLPNNQKFESISEWGEQLKDKPVRITVEHETWKEQMQARVKWVNESRAPNCQHEWKGEGHGDSSNTADNALTPDAQQQFVELEEDDGDLPF